MAISLKESLQVGFQDFWSRKLRSLVTIIGIILGTMSIIVILSLVSGMNEQTMKWMSERGGLSKITVQKNWEVENPQNLPEYFLFKEVLLIKSLVPEAEYFNASINDYSLMKDGQTTTYSRIIGTLPDYEKVEEWTADQGRFIKTFDIDESNDVIVLGSTIKEDLFGNKPAIGKTITVKNTKLRVIGVMRKRQMESSGGMFGDNPLEWMNRMSIIPLSTMINKFGEKNEISELTLKASSPDKATELKDKVENIILNLRKGQKIFSVESAQEEAEKMKENSKMFTLIFFFISSISLFVGGIVIMNIMLASIQERTREIGIRLAVGARRFDIFLQFLIQSVLITFIGGILGVISGVSIVKYVGKFLSLTTAVNVSMIYVALLVSVGVGLVFGILPAIRASKLDPVEALRYE